MKTLEVVVNSKISDSGSVVEGGTRRRYIVEPQRANADARRVHLAAICESLGANEVALKVRVPIGRREARVDVASRIGRTILLITYTRDASAQIRARQLSRLREELIGRIQHEDFNIRGFVAIEGSLDRSGDLTDILDDWANLGTLETSAEWTKRDLFGESYSSGKS